MIRRYIDVFMQFIYVQDSSRQATVRTAPSIIVYRDTVEASASETPNTIVPQALKLTINNSLDLSWKLFVSKYRQRDLLIQNTDRSANEYANYYFAVVIIHDDNFFNILNLIFALFSKLFANLNPICRTYYFRIKNAQ